MGAMYSYCERCGAGIIGFARICALCKGEYGKAASSSPLPIRREESLGWMLKRHAMMEDVARRLPRRVL